MYREEFESYQAKDDPRLLDVDKEVKRLRNAIDELEWACEDASHLYPAYMQMLAEQKAGRRHIPVF